MMEIYDPEKKKPKIYFPEVRAIIEGDKFLMAGQKDLAGKLFDKKDTLRHSQRITNMGYLLAQKLGFSKEETAFFVEVCLMHDIGKTEIPPKYLIPPSGKFGPKNLQVVSKHAFKSYVYLLNKNRNPRVCYPVLLHHEFQERPYPDTNAALLKKLGEVEDVDIDNARRLAMLDVFDTYAFGRPYSKIKPLPLEEVKEKLLAQFQDEGDEEMIDFLIGEYERVKELGGG